MQSTREKQGVLEKGCKKTAAFKALFVGDYNTIINSQKMSKYKKSLRNT